MRRFHRSTAGLGWTVRSDQLARLRRQGPPCSPNRSRKRFSGWSCSTAACSVPTRKSIHPMVKVKSPAAPSRPTLQQSVGLARMPLGVAIGDTVKVHVRDKQLDRPRWSDPLLSATARPLFDPLPSSAHAVTNCFRSHHDVPLTSSTPRPTSGFALKPTARSPSALPNTLRTCSVIWSSSICRTSAQKFVAEQEAAIVESVKAAADIYAPVAGSIYRGKFGGRRRAGIGQSGRLCGVAVQDEALQCGGPGRVA